MRSISLWMTTVSVGFLLMAACAPALSPSPPNVGPTLNGLSATGPGPSSGPPINNDGGTGGGTTNGIKPEIYYSSLDHINDMMTKNLNTVANTAWWPVINFPRPGTDPSTSLLDPATLAQLELDDALLLADIIGCSRAAKTSWTMPGYVPVYGEGLMNIPSDWLTTPLDTDPRPRIFKFPLVPPVDVHSCLVARLNAFGRVVPIWLMGPDVIPPAVGPGKFTYREAVFLAVPDFTLSVPTKIRLYAMPLDGIKSSCGAPDSAIQWRVCGKLTKGLRQKDSSGWIDVNGCHVQPMVKEGDPNPTNAPTCKQVVASDGTTLVDGSWNCTVPDPSNASTKTYAAIETRLDPSDWNLIYGCESGLTCTAPSTTISGTTSAARAHP